MEHAIIAAKMTYVKYHDSLVHNINDTAEYCMKDLPLVDAPNTKGKKFKEFFHLVEGISSEDCEAIRKSFNTDPPNIGQLPASVRPRDALGDSCTMQIAISPEEGGTFTVLKFFHSSVFIPLGLAKAFCGQKVLVINYQVANNSDHVKCAFLYMLQRIPGEQWLTQSLVNKVSAKAIKKDDGDGKNWEPTEDELRAGIAYINDHAPLANTKNEQFLWCLLNNRDRESPIYGWPHHVVSKACINRTVGNSQTDPEYFFPLVLHDLDQSFLEKVVPLVLPTMTGHGLILLGRAGVGKTPTAIILALAVARHLVIARGLDGHIPGWRRSKQIDGFRERPGELHVPVLLDDPLLNSMNMEDLKSFLDVAENTLVDARYRAAKFVRNQVRILLNNEWGDEKEPKMSMGDTVTWEAFRDMFSPAVNNASLPHMMAILKRATVVIAGALAVYVRLASEHPNQVVHRFSSCSMLQDWLKPTNKRFYGLYKEGQHVKPPGFSEALAAEANLVHELLASPTEKAYLLKGRSHDQWAETWGEDPAQPATVPMNTPRVVPSTSTASVQSPIISSPPSKQPRTSSTSYSQQQQDDDEADEEVARQLHSD